MTISNTRKKFLHRHRFGPKMSHGKWWRYVAEIWPSDFSNRATRSCDNLASQPVATNKVVTCRARGCFDSTMVFDCSEGTRGGNITEQECGVDATAKRVKKKIDQEDVSRVSLCRD